MTIGIEATKAFEREKTGVGWYSYYIVMELMKLIAPDVELRLYVNPWSNVKCQMSNVKCLRWPFKYFWTQGRLSLEMITNSPDILFIPAHLPPLVHPKKLVVTIHDLAFKEYPEVYSKKELRLQEWGIKRVLKRAWRIITPSEFTKAEIKKYYPRLVKDNIYVVRHGVFQNQNAKIKMQNENSKCKNIIYIGRLESKKNIVNLIKAFNIACSMFRVPCSMTLIGSPGYGYEEIKKEILQSPYKEHIKELGWLPQEEIITRLGQASLFAFPSLYEGFGLPLLEAMASAIPVACSDIPALREIGADIPVYFDPRNPHDMAQKITALLQNENLQNHQKTNGPIRASQYSWELAAQKTLEILTNP